MKGIILAGGRGTRLRPLTYSSPKSLLPVVNKTFLEYEIELLRAHEISRIVLSLNYFADEFRRRLQDGARWGVSLEYVVEESPLGTGGAIKNCEPFLEGERVLVMNGDVLTDANLSRLIAEHESRGDDVTISVAAVDRPSEYGLVIMNDGGRVTAFLEKPGWDEITTNTINAGMYVIEPTVVQRIPTGRETSFERDIIPALLAEGVQVGAYATDCYWLDIGTLSNYLRAHTDILAGKVDVIVPVPGRKMARGVFCGKNPAIHRTVRLMGPASIGNHVTIQARAEVGPWAAVGDRCRLAEGVSISESVLHEGVIVGKGSRLHRCILASGVRVGEECHLDRVVIAPASVIEHGTRTEAELATPASN